MTAEQAWDSILTLVIGPDIDSTKVDRSHRVTRFDIPYDRMTIPALKEAVNLMGKEGYIKNAKIRKDFPESDLANGPPPSPRQRAPPSGFRNDTTLTGLSFPEDVWPVLSHTSR